MAVINLKNAALFFKAEGAKGTAETLVAADGVAVIEETQITLPDTYSVRPKQGGPDYVAGVPGEQQATITFSINLAGSGGSGAVPLWAARLLPACGWGASGGTFTPGLLAVDVATATMAFHMPQTSSQSRIHTVAGVAGTFTIAFANGRPNRINFTFVGKYMGATTGTRITPTITSAPPPPRGVTSLAYNSVSIDGPAEHVLDAGNQTLVLPTTINDANETGFLHGHVSVRLSKFAMRAYARSSGTGFVDWDSEYKTRQERSLVLVVGATANNTITFTAINSKAQVISVPPVADLEGVAVEEVSLDLNESFTIAFS